MRFTDVVIHLRLPFSVFLLPIALFSLVACKASGIAIDVGHAILALIVWHLFVYPASNGFNSFYDRDDGPVGGIKHPPKVSQTLLWTATAFDIAGLALSSFAGPVFFLCVLVYILLSRAYSWDKTRLKRFPRFSIVTLGLIQGALVFCATLYAASVPEGIAFSKHTLPTFVGALVTILFLFGVYPITQIYQHEADAARGETSFSALLGIEGTFYWSAISFGLSGLGFGFFFFLSHKPIALLPLAVFLSPALVWFGVWWSRVRKDRKSANWDGMMRMNLFSSAGMNLALLLDLFLIP